MLTGTLLSRAAPRLPELLFAAILLWLFASGQGWAVLLADGDTGWHIRNGERIIDTATVPVADPFSFGSEGHPWFAWEWMSDVLFAWLFRQGGLTAVALFCGITIAAYLSVLFRHMLARPVGLWIALPLTLLAAGASSVHYLARPHVIGLFLFTMAAWVIDRERASPGRLIWGLPIVFIVWANCHGSFLGGLAVLGLWLVETVIEARVRRDLVACRKAGVLFTLCLGGTFCNPYGWRLHAHAIEYLGSSWIRETVQEFQSPSFRSENMLQYELVLIAGLAALPWLFRRKELYPCMTILFWAHQSLTSVRHVPLYCIVATPFTASWLQSNWDEWLESRAPGSLFHAFNSIDTGWKPWTRGFTVWPAVFCLAVVAVAARPLSFPMQKFPLDLVERNAHRLSMGARIFSSDQWSDYLIFRLYPGVRVFFDGRSDFFAPWRGSAYLELMRAGGDSTGILQREKVDMALLPSDWPLVQLLRRSPQWREIDIDSQAVLFARTPLKKNRDPSDRSSE